MKKTLLFFCCFCIVVGTIAQKSIPKKINKNWVGIFFEDISYAADGGLYAELIQNRSFEYTPASRKNWHPLSYWNYITDGFAYGQLDIETNEPLHKNNPHYAVLKVEDPGQQGMGISNSGFDGIVVKKGASYRFSVFIKTLSEKPMPITVRIQNKKGTVLGSTSFVVEDKKWKQYEAMIPVDTDEDSAQFVLLAKATGSVALDMVSLFPENTFKHRKNGMRADIATTIADLHPSFMRFPGGCLVHGDGLGNMYNWKNTIGPVEERKAQKNIWNYHQTVGLGYFEYFQFCEDIGAKPLPVVPAAVSCQNSGGTWRIGGTGQKGIPMDDMQNYIQDILDLIEYANGPVNSIWGSKRAAAGHPEPFHLKYIGVGNEDKMTSVFKERFEMIYNTLKEKHPEITVVGTVGPAPDGEDFTIGWKFANEWEVPIVDEHYYMPPNWFLSNQHRYDSYNRSNSKVYLGEYASKGNSLFNALAEAVYMTGLERNADVVTMASYAPMLAHFTHTSWNPNLIYFDNNTVSPTINYYVQQLFSINAGDQYFPEVVQFNALRKNDSTLAASCVKDIATGDLILKIVNAGKEPVDVKFNLNQFHKLSDKAIIYTLTGQPKDQNNTKAGVHIEPQVSDINFNKNKLTRIDAFTFQVIRIPVKK